MLQQAGQGQIPVRSKSRRHRGSRLNAVEGGTAGSPDSWAKPVRRLVPTTDLIYAKSISFPREVLPGGNAMAAVGRSQGLVVQFAARKRLDWCLQRESWAQVHRDIRERVCGGVAPCC